MLVYKNYQLPVKQTHLPDGAKALMLSRREGREPSPKDGVLVALHGDQWAPLSDLKQLEDALKPESGANLRLWKDSQRGHIWKKDGRIQQDELSDPLSPAIRGERNRTDWLINNSTRKLYYETTTQTDLTGATLDTDRPGLATLKVVERVSGVETHQQHKSSGQWNDWNVSQNWSEGQMRSIYSETIPTPGILSRAGHAWAVAFQR